MNMLGIVLSNLKENLEEVYKLLSFVATNISKSSDGKKLRFDLIGHNSNACSLDLDSMKFFNFRDNSYGDIIDLYLTNSNSKYNKNTFINKYYLYLLKLGKIEHSVDLSSEISDNYCFEYPKEYNEEELSKYPLTISKMFEKDNINKYTQFFWGIRYDKYSRRVVIPVYQDEMLVGAIGRRNTELLQDFENKYFPILTYRKSLVLFGQDEFRDLIDKTKTVILVESEKSVLKMWQMNTKIPVLALGSNSLSRYHIDRLKLLGVKKVIFALDKSLDYEDSLFPNIRKIIKYGAECKIQYIDVNNIPNEYLKEKEAICDRTQEEILFMFKNYLINYN